MAHIFLSYSREDVDKAKQLAEALEESGLSVWWDRTIAPGMTFDKVIEDALEDSSWAIVLWSSRSIASNWVKAEAEEALRRNNLVPVLIEDVRPPLAFRRLEAAELQNWDGDPNDHEFRQLVAVLTGLTPAAPPERPKKRAKPTPSPSPKTGMSAGKKMVLGAGLVVLVLGLILVDRDIDDFGEDIVYPAPQNYPPTYAEPRKLITTAQPDLIQAPATGAITLQYMGDNFNCVLDLIIDVGGQTVIPQSNQVVLNAVPLGNVSYTVTGTIGCPNVGVCTAYGDGTLNIRNGGAYNLMWQNTTFGECDISFAPAG